MTVNIFAFKFIPEKWRKFVQAITVEPAVFFYFIACFSLDFTSDNLYPQKTCRDHASTEPDLRTPCDDEKRGILYVNSVNYKLKFFLITSMMLHLMLTSSWSDRAGGVRKIFVLIPIIGQIMRSIFAIFQSYFWHIPVQWVVASDLISQIATGGPIGFDNWCKIYAADTTDFENRTMKLGIIAAINTLSMFIGCGLAGVLLRYVGFFYSYMICLILTVISFIFAWIFVNDVKVPVENKASVWSLFNLKHIWDSLRFVLLKHTGKKRIVVGILTLINFTVWFNMAGQSSIIYLYIRYRFKWDEERFGYYVMFKLIGISIGTFFCSFVLSKKFKVHDGIVGAFASFWDTLASVSYAFATQTWQLYLILVLDIFHGVALGIYYSYMTKLFEKNENGRVMAGVHITSLVTPLCYPAFSYTFKKTMDYFPSAFFLLGAVFDFITCILYGSSYYLCRKINSE